MKPNYIVIGAAKCATSSICNILSQHPDVFMVEGKEPQFFAHDDVYERGIEWYESLYDKAGKQKMRGEGSTNYTMKERFPETVSRIVSYTQDLKLIYVVRNPISRIESYWLQKRANGGEAVHYDFNTAVRLNRDWLVDSSNYWQQINAYRPYFPDNRIHIIFYEDFKADSSRVMRRCFEFLDVDPDTPLVNPNLHINSSSNKRIQGSLISRLRENSVYCTAVKAIPESLRGDMKKQKWFKQFFFKRINERPHWTIDNREWVADILEADTQQFLDYYGKPKNFWNLRGSQSRQEIALY
jgi:hypothetical protein